MNWISIEDEIPPLYTDLMVRSWNLNRYFYGVAFLTLLKVDGRDIYIWRRSHDLELLSDMKLCSIKAVSHWCQFDRITVDAESENTAEMYDFEKHEIINESKKSCN